MTDRTLTPTDAPAACKREEAVGSAATCGDGCAFEQAVIATIARPVAA